MKSKISLPEDKSHDRIATYLEGVASGCSEAANSSDFRVWQLLAKILQRVRRTITELERETARA